MKYIFANYNTKRSQIRSTCVYSCFSSRVRWPIRLDGPCLGSGSANMFRSVNYTILLLIRNFPFGSLFLIGVWNRHHFTLVPVFCKNSRRIKIITYILAFNNNCICYTYVFLTVFII